MNIFSPRGNTKYASFALVLLMLLGLINSGHAITVEELAEQFEVYKQQQAREFTKLREKNIRLREENKDLKSQFQTTQEQVDSNTAAVETVADSYDGAAKVVEWFDKTTIGGYGELHYNNLSQKPGKEDGKSFREADFHRFILFFGHEFTDDLRFFSEFELEHALTKGDGTSNGEVELEQAFIEYDAVIEPIGLLDNANIKGGVFLIPVGILNETHEPPTFYGVERNDVENIIIPSTWWEAGVGTTLNFAPGVSLDLAVTSGLEISTEEGSKNQFRIRSGRNKVSNASADDFAYTTRLKYTGIPGLEVAGTAQYQADITQEQNDGAEGAWLYEGHVDFDHNVGPGNFGFRALYAMWDISGSAVEAAGADDQEGWYVEPSYKINLAETFGGFPFPGDLGVYTRYEHLDGHRDQDRFNQWEAGFNYWPHEDVVVKFDYRNNNSRTTSNRDFKGIDIGLGYQF